MNSLGDRDNRAATLAPSGYGIPGFDPARMRRTRVLIAGLGNIGGHLAQALGPLVGFMRLVDRDRVDRSNLANQSYGPAAREGQWKVEAMRELLLAANPSLVIEARAWDIADLPLGEVADVDLCFAGLDSLLARRMLISDRAYPLGVPAIDGGVGAPLLGSVRVYVPGSACLGCCWSERHYRAIASEYPCGGDTRSTAAVSPALLGQAVAGFMTAEGIKLLTGLGSRESRELVFSLLHARLVSSRLKPAVGCRHDHEVVVRRVVLGVPFAQARVQDLLAAAAKPFGPRPMELEFRRLTLNGGPFTPGRFARPAILEPYRHQPLSKIGLTRGDFVRVRASGQRESAFLVLDPRPPRQEEQA